MRLRNMTAIYLLNGEDILLLYRVGSRVVGPSWCGIGGHFESDELNDPTACVLRELHEETGIRREALRNLRLRYIALRQKDDEVRQNHYFFADYPAPARELPPCSEGVLEWVPVAQALDREMPYSARHCLAHYFATAHGNGKLYAGVATETGMDFVPLAAF